MSEKKPLFIDTHAHLDFSDYHQDRKQVIDQIFDSGCIAVINPGADLETSKSAIELSHSHEKIFAAVGIHPHEAVRYLASGTDIVQLFEEEIQRLRELAKKDKVVAIGECGLDYFRFQIDDPSTSKVIAAQKELFRMQLEVAKALQLPVIIHARDAYEDVLEIIDIVEHVPAGVAHCYEGSWPVTEVLLSRGFFIGFTANITYPKKEQVHEVIKKIPLESIVLETDAPFLSPQGRRGQRNDSRSVIDVGNKIAELKGISAEEVFRQTTNNAIRLYNLPLL